MTAFELKANKTAYYMGEDMVDERIRATNPKPSFDEYHSLLEELARGAYEDDGYTELGQLTEEETYFLLIEFHSIEEANKYLVEIGYNNIEAVA